ncbi:hypothetical protein NQ317_010564 [Molorchus minor]|uniref:C-CAP/cofactor C-like domain-containing protein n=1 Tax=Molorchus minor TaxID=1323400 RepID=A0ABQ9JBV9_9CUCU|nr:hypothetical protein NQ317_010564 [Molorchus minor]
MSVPGYTDIINGPLSLYLQISSKIGGDVAEHSKLVQEAFNAQLQYLQLASISAQPAQNEIIKLLKPTSDKISAIQDYREKHRSSSLFNHLSAISESISALGWVTNGRKKDKQHVDWVKAWIQALSDLQAFVKQYHTTGLVWTAEWVKVPHSNRVAFGARGMQLRKGYLHHPPGALLPPPVIDLDVGAAGDAGLVRSALFAEINKGQDITKGLKKVTADMQTHKNSALRQGPAPFKPTVQKSVTSVRPTQIVKPPSFVKDGKKWLIEYQKGNQNLLVENAEMNNVVYLFKCENSTVTVKGKINSITLDSCKKTSVVFDSLVSSMEFINCQSVQMQVLGKVPTISIDKTDGCQIYLSNDSLDVEIISSKSSEMNVLLPKGDGDYTEIPIPEQFRTRVSGNKTLSTEIVESKG